MHPELPAGWVPPTHNETRKAPYFIKETPRGAVVACRGHLVTDEIKTEEALALRDALNAAHKRTNAE